MNIIGDLSIAEIIDDAVEEVCYIAMDRAFQVEREIARKNTLIMERIRALPQVLQDLIAEYNVDHRPQMFAVHRQVMHIPHISKMKWVFRELEQTVDRYSATHCDNCTDYIEEYNRIDTTFYGYIYHYCCDRCQWESIYDLRKQMKRDTKNQKLSV